MSHDFPSFPQRRYPSTLRVRRTSRSRRIRASTGMTDATISNTALVLRLLALGRLPARRRRLYRGLVFALLALPLCTGAELPCRALAGEGLADRVEVVEIVRQLGHVDQAVDLGFVELDEKPEAGDTADRAFEAAADVLLHPGGAVAVVDLARGVVGATRALRTLQRQGCHLAR